MISNRCARKSLVTNCNSIISKNYLRFLVDSNEDTYLINRYVIRHAGNAGLPDILNTRNFMLEVSNDGKEWSVVDRQYENTLSVTDVDIVPVKARYVRISISDSGKDHFARIADIEIYGCSL